MLKNRRGVRLENVSKVYVDPKTHKPFYAVRDVSLSIEPGAFVTLLGPSGCGKTTTLRMIAGFESPDAGEIYLGEQPMGALLPNKRDTAMVFQSYALFPHMNVFDNVAYGLRLRKCPREEIQRRVEEMLALVEMSGMEGRMTHQLSGGQQQRVALARAIVVEPSVLLFDEPLSNLDAKLRVSMRTEIRRIQQTLGITAVYVTHDQAEAMSLSDQIIVMNAGVVAQMGAPEAIYNHPESRFVADFIGEANFLDGVVEAVHHDGTVCDVRVGNARVTMANPGGLAVGAACAIVLRPEAGELADEGLLPCEVTLSCFMGAYRQYHVRVGERTVKLCDYRPQGKRAYAVGERAFLRFAPAHVHLLGA